MQEDWFGAIWKKALIAHQQGQLVEAYALYKVILSHDPAWADALHLTGVVLYQREQPYLAVDWIRRALSLQQDAAPYYANLGIALLETGQRVEALAATTLALVIDPGFGEAVINHASSLRENDQPETALQFAQRGVHLRPGIAAAHTCRGHCLYVLDRQEEAAMALRQAVALTPSNAKALHLLGLSEAALGLPGAKMWEAAACRMMPLRVDFLYGLSSLHKFQQNDEWFVRVKELEADMDLHHRDVKMQLYFILAKAYEDIGDKEESFRYQLLANPLKRQMVDYDEQVSLGLFRRTRAIFTREFLAAKFGPGDPDSLPIFIVGMPRSGTSLIEQILASHPDVYGAGELLEFSRLVDFLGEETGGLYIDIMPDVTPQALQRLGGDYIKFLRGKHPTARFITDKLPGNLAMVGIISLALPNAKIIQLRRDPLDACLSCYSKLFTGGLNYTYDLGELGRFAHEYQLMMDHWEQVIPKDRLLSLSYSDVVADQLGQTRRLLEFCGLPWNDACLSFYRNERVVKTASVHQVRQPIYKSSLRRWRPDPQLIAPLLRGLQGVPD